MSPLPTNKGTPPIRPAVDRWKKTHFDRSGVEIYPTNSSVYCTIKALGHMFDIISGSKWTQEEIVLNSAYRNVGHHFLGYMCDLLFQYSEVEN
jgi:hypothetical protein